MRLEFAVLAGAVLIAGAIAITNRWEIIRTPGAAVFMLDKWSGVVTVCAPLKGDLYSAGPGYQLRCSSQRGS